MNGSLGWRGFATVASVGFSLLAAAGAGCGGSSDATVTVADASTATDTGVTCNKAVCGGSCVDTKVDPANCGACGNACPEGLACSEGSCALVCAGGTTKCGNACHDLSSDPNNCGRCGSACLAGQLCSAGTCAVSCQAGLLLCDGKCIDPNTNPLFCGASGACGAGGGSAGTACPVGNGCAHGECALLVGAMLFDSLTGAPSTSELPTDFGCGSQVSVATTTTIRNISANVELSKAGNLKYVIFTHPAHTLVYVSAAKPTATGSGWKDSDALEFTFTAGQDYDIGVLADVATSRSFDNKAESTPPFTSHLGDPVFTTFAAPTVATHALVDCSIRLWK